MKLYDDPADEMPCPACGDDGFDRFGDRCPLGCGDRYVDAPTAPAPSRSYALDEDPFPLTGVAAP